MAALIAAASISSSYALTGNFKVGVLNFALSDTYQHYVLLNTKQSQSSACELLLCGNKVQYQTTTEQINNKRIITAIGKALGVTFTTKAQLAVVNYDNDIPAPPYPPYLACENVGATPPDTFNAPWDLIAGLETSDYYDLSFGAWPNAKLIDWVDYNQAASDNGVLGRDGLTQVASEYKSNPSWMWNKSEVHISDPSNPSALLQCYDVSPFFSFEEAFCYFCWDTVDRVSVGTFQTTSAATGDICIGGGGCGLKGGATTKFYMTIKFNNVASENQYIAANFPLIYLDVNTIDELSFSVGGVVSYPWTFKKLDGVSGAFGTMTMATANGYGREPYCGVLTGNVKITETTDARVPLPCIVH